MIKANWVKYKNGNYNVILNLDNGTKIRETIDPEATAFIPETIESFDCKITNSCDMGCPMCHENSIPNGKHGDLFAPSFLDTLHPYTEIAIGGGNPLEHPDLYKFLQLCKERKFIPSMTVNQVHFEKNFDFIKKLVDEKLIYGLGVSLNNVNKNFVDKLKEIPNAVVHIINGLVTKEQLEQMRDLGVRKVLILGYKIFRRGETLYSKEADAIEAKESILKELLPKILKEKWFDVVSFDNLALKQLDVKSLLSEKEWNQFYMGDDGLEGEQTSASMFIDMVERKFAKNSCSKERFNLLPTVEEMYSKLRG